MYDKRQLKLINKLFNIEKTYDTNSEEEAILEEELLELFEEEMPDEDFRSNVMELINKEDVQFKNRKLGKNKKTLIAACAAIIALIIILPYNKVIVDALEQWVRNITITNDGISQTFNNVDDMKPWRKDEEIELSKYEEIKIFRPICEKEYVNIDSKEAEEYIKNESILGFNKLRDLELGNMKYQEYSNHKIFEYTFLKSYTENSDIEDYGVVNVFVMKCDGNFIATDIYSRNKEFKKTKVLSYEAVFENTASGYEDGSDYSKAIIVPIPEERLEIKLEFQHYLSKNPNKNLEKEAIKMMEQIIKEVKKNRNLKVITKEEYCTTEKGEKYLKEKSIIKLHDLLGMQLDNVKYTKYNKKEIFSYLYMGRNSNGDSSETVDNITVDITKYNRGNSGNISIEVPDFKKVKILSYDSVFTRVFDGKCLELYMPDKKIKIHLSSTNDMEKEDAIKAMETIIRDINK